MRKFVAKIPVGLLPLLPIVALVVSMYTLGESLDKQSQLLEPSVQINKNCSATVIASDRGGTWLITAQHCVNGKPSGVINYATTVMEGVTVKADIPYKVVDEDVKNDLALIHTTTVGFKVAQVATEKPAEGQEVWTVGYPLSLPRQLSTGFYGLNVLVGEMDHQRASSFIAVGNSGGGLFVIEDGVYKLVGVTSKGMLSQTTPSMFTPIGLYSELGPVRSLIDRNLANWE